MRIALPTVEGQVCLHFGHCQAFALVDVEDGKVTGDSSVEAPPHEPGLLPPWLAEKGVNIVLASGMGMRAQGLFNQQGIEVVTGCSPGNPVEVVEAYLAGDLKVGDNPCGH